MNTIKAYVTDIIWDTDDESIKLPEKVTLKLNPENAEDISIEDYVSDLLSDLYGYCHKGFKLKIEK